MIMKTMATVGMVAGLIACAVGSSSLSAGSSVDIANHTTYQSSNRGVGKVAYDDYNIFLSQLVLDVGMPDRIVGGRPSPGSGTKMIKGNKKKTRSEANRLFYHNIKDQGYVAITAMRKSLEAVTGTEEFDLLSPNERLAFWLNLRNLAVIELVGENYPVKNAQKLVDRAMEDKRLTVRGEPWSIQDIEVHVLTNWSNRLVIYGFHRGHIGSPNIRRRAYTGASVWKELRENAEEFTYSLRGIQFKRDTAFVSQFYASVAYAFEDFEKDLRVHLRPLLSLNLRAKLDETKRIKARIRDSTVADLYAGRTANVERATGAGRAALVSGMNVNGALASAIWAKSAQGRSTTWPAHVQDLVRELSKRNFRRRLQGGTVTIERVESDRVER